MLTLGILLPGSTLYPSIGMDFLQGIKSCFKFNEYSDIDYKVDIIGYGIKDQQLYEAAEKFLIIDSVDIVIAYVEDRHAVKLSPLFIAAGKLLIVANGGANYPELENPNISHTIFHSLNDSVCCYMTGKLAALQSEGKGAILATSFYDGGYKHTHAIANAYMRAGGEIKHNYVSHFKKEEFNTTSLINFINENNDIRKILAVFSGDIARYFYKNILEQRGLPEMQWYCSPMMFDCTPGDFTEVKPMLPADLIGHTYWIPELQNETNQTFIQYYKAENAKVANLFVMHGWESALLIIEYLKERNNSSDTESAINQLINKKINSPRGIILLNKERYILGPAYLVSAKDKLQVTVEQSIEDTSSEWHEMMTQIPDGPVSTWQNTYLCI